MADEMGEPQPPARQCPSGVQLGIGRCDANGAHALSSADIPTRETEGDKLRSRHSCSVTCGGKSTNETEALRIAYSHLDGEIIQRAAVTAGELPEFENIQTTFDSPASVMETGVPHGNCRGNEEEVTCARISNGVSIPPVRASGVLGDIRSASPNEKRSNQAPPISACTESSTSPKVRSGLSPLSQQDIIKFENDGFVMLKEAFDPEVASTCREHLWRRLHAEGIRQDVPSTWVPKKGIAEIYGIPSSKKKRRGHPWTSALSPRLKAAVAQLVGEDAWEDFGCGWWVVTFPGFAQGPWGAEGKWHIDGAHFRHFPHSREIGLLPIFLFSDVRPCGGGTAVLRSSHKKTAEILWKHAGTAGMTGPQLSSAARAALLPAATEDVVEITGTAGDIMLTHPLLLHSRSTNLAPVETAGVRFMCHPAVPLKRHMDFHVAPEGFSPVQSVIWRSRPDGAEEESGDTATIPTPDQCDHSAVPLPSWGASANSDVGYWARKRRR